MDRPQTRSPAGSCKGGGAQSDTVGLSALAAIEAGRDHLERNALATEGPALGVVDAADHLVCGARFARGRGGSMRPAYENAPAVGGRGVGNVISGQSRHAQGSPFDRIVHAIEGATGIKGKPSGPGMRLACCGTCMGSRSLKVSVTEAGNGAILLHAFCGCSSAEVLAGAGLSLADLFPVRLKPHTPEERRAARRVMREASWRAALVVVDTEIAVIQAAARMVARWQCLSAEDDDRVQLAVDRIAGARGVLNERA